MSYSLDFKQLATTPILHVAAMLGLVLTEKDVQLNGQTVKQYSGSCPISQLSNATAFKITPSINRYVCFCAECKKAEKRGGDCIELVRRVKRLDYRAAAGEIQKHFGAGKAAENAQPQQEVETSRNSSGFDPLKYLATLDAEHETLAEVASPTTLKTLQGGYCSKGVHRGRLSIAVCDQAGAIQAFVGVSLEDDSLLFHKGYEPPYWFNTHSVQEGELRVLPTIKAVLNAVDSGEPNVICPLKPTNAGALKELADLLEDRKCVLAW